MVQLRQPRLRLHMLGFWDFFYGSGADPDLTTIKYLGGSGQNVSARAVPTRAARRFRAAGGMLSGQEGVEWLKGR